MSTPDGKKHVKTPRLIVGGGSPNDFDGCNGTSDDLGHWVPQHFFHFLREAQDQYQGTAQHGLKALGKQWAWTNI